MVEGNPFAEIVLLITQQSDQKSANDCPLARSKVAGRYFSETDWRGGLYRWRGLSVHKISVPAEPSIALTELLPRVDYLRRRVKIDFLTGARNRTGGAEIGWIIQCKLLIPVVAAYLLLGHVLYSGDIGAYTAADQ